MNNDYITKYNLCCPKCHGGLRALENRLKCSECRAEFTIRENIPQFVENYRYGDFYAEKFTRSLPWSTKEALFMLYHPSYVRYRFFARHLKKGIRILDLGCGGGIGFLKRYGQVVGLELSHTAAKTARSLYDYVVVANSSQLPFADNSFDAVVSLDVLGHIPPEEKKQVIKEIERVLKPGGMTIHFSEADGRNPWARFAKRSPSLYRKHFIDQDGHYGILTPTETMRMFNAFELIEVRSVYKFFTAAEEYVKRFDNEYKSKSRVLSFWVTLCRACVLIMPVKAFANLLLNMARGLTDAILPTDWADGVLLAYRKR